MRIGIFTDSYEPYISGLVTSTIMLKKALERKGHKVFVVTVNLKSFKYEYDPKKQIIKLPGVPIGIYDARLPGIYDIRAYNQIKKWNLDVIHSQTEFGIGTFSRIIAKQLDIPLVHTYHTMYEDYIDYITKGHFENASKKIVEYLTKFYCDKTATELIVPTEKAYDLFKKKYKVDRNVHIVPTGIEIDRFYKENFKQEEIDEIRKLYNINKNDFVILFVGRLGYEKSVDVLIDAHKVIVKQNKNAKLLIIGDGPEADKFREMANKLKIIDNIVFTGKIPWDLIPKYYQLATVFATASKTETQGLTVIEAMAGSVPAICVNDRSFNTTVIDNLNGRLFEDKKEYINQIIELMNDKKKLERLSNQARISAEAHSSKYFAERVLGVYKIAIGKEKKDKSLFGRIKKVFKRGLHEK